VSIESSYEDTVLGTWKNHLLFSALIELTYRCNLDCYFCYNDLDLEGQPLRFADYERLFEEMKSLGCLHLTLSGGEPLAHPDFFSIGAKARELGFVVRVKSNGHALGAELSRRLVREVDPFIVEVSLHGARAETHDRQTRVTGSFERLIRNLDAMREARLRVKINTAVTRWNETEIEGMFAIADRFGMPLTLDPEVTPRDNGDRGPMDISASPEGLRGLVAIQSKRVSGTEAEIRREGDAEIHSGDPDRHCGAGASGIAVDPFGNVYPCVQWRRSIGNVHHSSLEALWHGNGKLDDIRRLTVEAKEVVGNHHAKAPLVGFCPGVAEMLTGSPLTVHESTSQRASILSELPLHPQQ
jgi:MoaA/NifB/PqqE/SkfB family radical SAM enzyme